jgi:hypothetical protein
MKNLLVLFISAFTVIGLQFTAPNLVSAATSKDAVCEGIAIGGGTTGTKCDPAAATEVSERIKRAIQIFQVIVGLIAVFYLIYGGLKFITAGGDPGGVKSARNTIIYAAIGLIIVLIAQFIVQFVINRFD